ncbi:MAG: hypothetical protein AB7E72_17045 [Lysobacterales bacterium]
MKLDDYRSNPAEHFRSPDLVVKHPSLSADDKKEILTSWKDELMQLQAATAENMPRLDESNGPTISLQQVELALEQLEAATG